VTVVEINSATAVLTPRILNQNHKLKTRGQIFEIFLRHFPKIFLCQMIWEFQRSFLIRIFKDFLRISKELLFLSS